MQTPLPQQSVIPTRNENRERFFETCDFKIKYKIQKFMETNKCDRCWLTNKFCICDQIRRVHLENEYFVIFHHKEFLRGSNTGKLLPLSVGIPSFPFPYCPLQSSNVRVFIHGVKESEELLLDEISKRSLQNIALLYPADNSIKITDWIENITQHNFETNQEIDNSINEKSDNDDNNNNDNRGDKNSEKNNDKKKTIIVVDGTWAQGSKLVKSIDEKIQRVRLDFSKKSEVLSQGDEKEENGLKSIFDNLRRQPKPDRVSTLDSLIFSMEILGESSETCSSLYSSLKLLVNAMLMQTGGKGIEID